MGTTGLTVAEFYVEVFHARGNFSLFEIWDEDNQKWVEVDVWKYRNADDSFYRNAQYLEDFFVEIENMAGVKYEKLLRVTRHPELERDTVDATYHPSVPAWKIDLTTVKEHLKNGNE